MGVLKNSLISPVRRARSEHKSNRSECAGDEAGGSAGDRGSPVLCITSLLQSVAGRDLLLCLGSPQDASWLLLSRGISVTVPGPHLPFPVLVLPCAPPALSASFSSRAVGSLELVVSVVTTVQCLV